MSLMAQASCVELIGHCLQRLVSAITPYIKCRIVSGRQARISARKRLLRSVVRHCSWELADWSAHTVETVVFVSLLASARLDGPWPYSEALLYPGLSGARTSLRLPISRRQ